MHTITSLKNPAVMAARALQTKAARDESGLFLCDGEHMVSEAVRFAGKSIQTIFVNEKCVDSFAPLLIAATNATVYSVPEHVLAAISQVKTPQGIVAIVKVPKRTTLDALGNRVVLLENVQDPGNVGTILRTADAAGFDACVLTPGCADPFSPKALRATMGSVFRIPVAQEASGSEAARTLAGMGYAVIATVLEGEDFYKREPLPPKVCIIVGNEGAGVTPDTRAAATHLYRLPMRGGTESLNAGIATAIFLYEIANRG